LVAYSLKFRFICLDATGTTNISNSELAFLGYDSSLEEKHTPSNGLSFFGSNGSIVRGNNIPDNNFGFYSATVGGLLIENNHIHHNTYYGLDPHSGTNDMIIRNNVVHDNGKIGIICSQHCRNITIENNEVYNNIGSGISFSIDMTNSVARGNVVYNQDRDGENGISVSRSSNNRIYNNTISFSEIGIKIINNSSNNYVYNNSLSGLREYSFLVRGSASVNNTFEDNELDDSKTAVRLNNNSGSLFEGNDAKDTTSYGQEYLVQDNSTLNLEKTSIPSWMYIIADNSSNNVVNINDSGRIIVKGMEGDTTNFDTDIIPYSSRINNETLSIMSHTSMIQNNTT
jgi:parallel beta-helix repeat protein